MNHDARYKHEGDLPLEVRERERDRAVAAIRDYLNRLEQSPATKAAVLFAMTLDGKSLCSAAMGDAESLAVLNNAAALGIMGRL